jgi:hypothetical protein
MNPYSMLLSKQSYINNIQNVLDEKNVLDKVVLYFKGVFDLLKNEGHDITTSIVQCLICKIVSSAGQTGGKGHDKN